MNSSTKNVNSLINCSLLSCYKPVWISFEQNNVDNQTVAGPHWHSMDIVWNNNTMEVSRDKKLVTNILENIFFCVQQNKEIGLEQLEGDDYQNNILFLLSYHPFYLIP